MLFGFAINRQSGCTDFGVVVSDCLSNAASDIEGLLNDGDEIQEIFEGADAESLIYEQYDGVAFLTNMGD